MNQEKLIWQLSEKLRSHLKTDEVLIEVALLAAWKFKSDFDDDIASLRDVLEGKASLMAVYKEMGNSHEIGEYYRNSHLPHHLSPNDVEDLLTLLLEIKESSISSLLDSLHSNTSKSFSELGLPVEVSCLMVELGEVDGKTVYAPFGGSISLAKEAKEKATSVSVEAKNSPIVAITGVLSKLDIKVSDPLTSPSFTNASKLNQFDCVLMNPPWGLKIKDKFLDRFNRFGKDLINGDVMCLQHALGQTKERLVTLSTQGLLFQSRGSSYEWRVDMIEKGWIDSVIQLPPNLLFNTSIPAVILVINKLRNPEYPVYFFDSEQEGLFEPGGRGERSRLLSWKKISEEVLNKQTSAHASLIERDELIKNDYDLSVRRYVLGEGTAGIKQLQETVALESLGSLIRAQLLKEDSEASGSEEYFEVGARDIADNGAVTKPTKSIKLKGRMSERAKLQRIQPGDIIFSTKGTVGKVGIVTSDCGDNWVVNQTFQVIRMGSATSIIEPAYLYMYLKSPLVQAYLAEQASGSAIQVLKTGDVKKLPIQIASKERQNQVIDAYKEIVEAYSKIADLKENIQELNSKFWPC
tara:strand:+ start:1263 stop:2999 length:1737 start_codon:yes stop_codon:yes gene_type:complete